MGITLSPWHLAVIVWWDGPPLQLGRQRFRLCASGVSAMGASTGRGIGLSCGVVVGKQEFRFDLALNYWGVGIDLVETDDWSIHLGPLDIECEYDKFYDLDDEWLRPADLRLFSKKREPCECEREPVRHD